MSCLFLENPCLWQFAFQPVLSPALGSAPRVGCDLVSQLTAAPLLPPCLRLSSFLFPSSDSVASSSWGVRVSTFCPSASMCPSSCLGGWWTRAVHVSSCRSCICWQRVQPKPLHARCLLPVSFTRGPPG